MNWLIFTDSSANRATDTVVVEGLSKNVTIACSINNPKKAALYWQINNLIFEAHTLPEIFKANSIHYDSFDIPEVDRRMNNWRFQCFIVETLRNSITYGETITTLTVIVVNSEWFWLSDSKPPITCIICLQIHHCYRKIPLLYFYHPWKEGLLWIIRVCNSALMVFC